MKNTALLNGYNSMMQYHITMLELSFSKGKTGIFDAAKAKENLNKIEILISKLES